MSSDPRALVRREPAGDAPKPRNKQLRPALREALVLIVEQGLTIPQAAQAVGYTAHSLTQALKKPHVIAAKSGVRRAWMASKTESAWRTVAELASTACSEDTRLKAARVFIDQDIAANAKTPDGNRQLVQIIVQAPSPAGQPLAQRLPGVIEGQVIQRLTPQPSNTVTVGRVDDDPSEAP